jgi:hypothetical protein
MHSAVDELLPGAEIVARGLSDLAANRETIESLLVSMAATRLGQLGYRVAEPLPDPEHRLWELLASDDADAAHGRYNALVRRLVSFQRAAACAA